MPDHDVIYQEQASMYDRLISKQKSVIPFLEKIHSGKGADIVDIEAGTGRLTVPLAKVARSIVALDESAGMLAVTAEKLKAEGLDHWQVQVADHRRLPMEDDQADLVVAGWSICYLASSNHPTWRKNLSQIIGEIRRVLKPGGGPSSFLKRWEPPRKNRILRIFYAGITGLWKKNTVFPIRSTALITHSGIWTKRKN
ncbi:class I SAM-dependent methyltransferase [Thermoactinomyces sp. FSL K6-2592]|uniref:class I SAM-dependent methyltransferase n=1 Tax=unclassified Thermoactinomyces TaxID=2634588 RepID=UPI0030F6267A